MSGEFQALSILLGGEARGTPARRHVAQRPFIGIQSHELPILPGNDEPAVADRLGMDPPRRGVVEGQHHRGTAARRDGGRSGSPVIQIWNVTVEIAARSGITHGRDESESISDPVPEYEGQKSPGLERRDLPLQHHPSERRDHWGSARCVRDKSSSPELPRGSSSWCVLPECQRLFMDNARSSVTERAVGCARGVREPAEFALEPLPWATELIQIRRFRRRPARHRRAVGSGTSRSRSFHGC